GRPLAGAAGRRCPAPRRSPGAAPQGGGGGGGPGGAPRSSTGPPRRMGREAPAAAGAGQAVIPAEDRLFHPPVPIWLESAVGSTLGGWAGRPPPTAPELPPRCLGRRELS